MKAIFNIEKVLQSYIDFHYSGKDTQKISWFLLIQHLLGLIVMQDQYGNPIDFVPEDDWVKKKDKFKLISNRDYYKVDFFDFAEYSTSELADNSKLFDLLPQPNRDQKRQIMFFDSIYKNTTEPLFESCLGGFEIDSAFIYPFNSNSVLTGLRIKNVEPNKSPYNFTKNFIAISNYVKDEKKQDFIQTMRALLLEDYNKQFPFFFQTETNLDCKFKMNRFGLMSDVNQEKKPDLPEYKEGMQEVEYFMKSEEYYDFYSNSEMTLAFDTDFQIYFEALRLLLCMPNYIDFMYDLILPERITVGQKTVQRIAKNKQGKRKKKYVAKPIYKIIKSIKVRYLVENRLRNNGIIIERNWTPPKYRYEVRGHWRKLPKSDWKGHDPQGKIILGKTWIHQYHKGGNEKIESLILEKQPTIVIKIKQPLSFAKDVIKSSLKSSTIINNETSEQQKNLKEIDKPSDEWIYSERQKLTSSLRYLIIKRDNFRCQICGASPIEDKKIKLEV